ncbi:hypothetical protein R0135_08940 [Congregibacter variabilis]|uniref:Uncharacterized protein n=1 Tax=Congregibacter variabilis TaxID=3081200 RepID=A0ABZ0HYD9_9GAMM|nr:hypothetical protein R0135_08940 [Congregibacter sp. IMCC43200]
MESTSQADDSAARTADSTVAGQGGRFFALNPRQILKIVVYGLLLINFAHYFSNDINVLRHTVHEGWRWMDWTTAFATTLDESAWFLLLLLLELETYLLSDAAFTKGRLRLMHGLRVVCYLAIGHTVFAFSEYLLELNRATEHMGVALCSFADSGLSFARNLQYWDLSAANCEQLSRDTHFFQFAQNQVLTDSAGMVVEWELAWADLFEVLLWLLILMMIEVMVRLQEKGVAGGAKLRIAQGFKGLLYSLLWLIAAYWAYRGHWVFAWDEALWILGFMAIGMNLSQWRQEIRADVAP